MNYEELHVYPLTVIEDRYNGCYSWGRWTAWNMHHDKIPFGPFADDCSCAEFWHEEHTFPVGIGNTPDEAIQDLLEKMGTR